MKHGEGVPGDAERLQAFCRSVQNIACWDHDVYLARETIAAELDTPDLVELRDCPADQRRAWAAMLAYRLVRERVEG